MMTTRAIVLVAALLAATGTAFTVKAAGRPNAAACGGALWHLKTLSDADRNHVNVTPKSTTISALRALGRPSPLPRSRRTSFQRQSWEVVAAVIDYHVEQGSLVLTLYDDPVYMQAELPIPSCLTKTSRQRSAIASAFQLFTTRCGHPTDQKQPLGAIMYVRGIGFWSARRTGPGVAPNGAELSPVTGFRLVVGCGD
jgi:hypothetical protein